MAFDVASKSKSMDQGGKSLKKQGDVSASNTTAETGAGAMSAAIAPEARVDHWFDRQLVNLYGEVANEPIPDEILTLIKKLKTPH
jgi:hypothetical protein